MDNKFQLIQVGEKFTLVKQVERFYNFEGAFMEMHEGGELSIMIFLPDMSDKEKDTLMKAKIKVNILENKNMLVTYINFTGSQLVFELPFNPEKYPDARVKKFNPKGLINVIGVRQCRYDSADY